MEELEDVYIQERIDKVLLTTKEAAEYLGVSDRRIAEWTRLKYDPLPRILLPNCKYPYFTKADIDAFVDRYRVSK